MGAARCVKCNAPLNGSMVGIARPETNRQVDNDQMLKETVREFGAGERTDGMACCPDCGYPYDPRMGECPRCGGKGPEREFRGQQAEAKKTSTFAQGRGKAAAKETVNPWGKPRGGTGCSLTPVAWENEEEAGAPVKYTGDAIVLNRANTDPENPTITSKEQAVLTREGDAWYIEDRSQQRTTFVHAGRRTRLEDGDVVFCDSGTTIQCMCAELIYRLQKDKLNIKIYTNSLANLEILSPHMQVNLVGGEYRANRKDFCGYLSEQALSGLFFTKSFVGADGCVGGTTFTTTDFETARMNQIAMRNSNQTYMLVDSSKFSNPSHVAYVPAESLYTIVTDSDVSQQTLEQLKKTNARLICVNI